MSTVYAELLIWLETILGKKLLQEILGVKDKELAAYTSRAVGIPETMGPQLNFLAQVAIFLFGGYNNLGIRQWFRRRRKQLDGKSPREILSGKWNPQDAGPQKVLALARSMNA